MILYLDKENKKKIVQDWIGYFPKLKKAQSLIIVKTLTEYAIDGIYLRCSGNDSEHYKPMYFITFLFEDSLGTFSVANDLKDGRRSDYVRMSFHDKTYEEACARLQSQNVFLSKETISDDELIHYLKQDVYTSEDYGKPVNNLEYIAFIMIYKDYSESDKLKFYNEVIAFLNVLIENSERLRHVTDYKEKQSKIKDILFGGSITKESLQESILKNLPKVLNKK